MVLQNPSQLSETEELVADSIALYQQATSLLLKMQKSCQTGPLSPHRCPEIQVFSKLQNLIDKKDRQILKLLEGTAENRPVCLEKMLSTRMSVMEKVFNLNREILTEATRVKALLHNELKNIVSGRGAIKGYGDAGKRAQNNFSNSC